MLPRRLIDNSCAVTDNYFGLFDRLRIAADVDEIYVLAGDRLNSSAQPSTTTICLDVAEA